jgi:hypothetical protein
VGQDLVVDAPPGRPQWFDGQPVVLGGPGHDGVGDQRQAPGLLGLFLQVTDADGALVGIRQAAFEGVQRLALVELAGDLAPIRRIRQVAGGVDRAAQRSAPYSLLPRLHPRRPVVNEAVTRYTRSR